MIWTVLRPFAPYIAGGFAILAALLYVGHLRGELKDARADLRAARVELSRCQDNRKALDAALKLQNAAVMDLKRAGDETRRQTDQAEKDAQKRQAASVAKAAKLEALSRTFGKGDDCKDMEAADRAVLGSLK